jgi:hypothetical protein
MEDLELLILELLPLENFPRILDLTGLIQPN